MRASWVQSDVGIFNNGYAGVQCLTMVLANIVRAAIFPRKSWTTNILNENMIEGDILYGKIRDLTANNSSALQIGLDGFLEISHLNILRSSNLSMFGQSIAIEYDENTEFFGSLQDSVNISNIGFTLKDALMQLLSIHNAGILIASRKSYGVMCYQGKYYFTNSHSCGRRGAPVVDGYEGNGKACIVECDTIDELYRICRRATKSRNEQYTINYDRVRVEKESINNGELSNKSNVSKSNNATINGNNLVQ